MHGFKTTRYGSRLDKYGRIVYLDTFSRGTAPAGGAKTPSSRTSRRASSVTLPRRGTRSKGGYTHPPGYHAGHRGPGNGQAYRMTIEGPGVTPDVKWEGKGLPRYNPSAPGHVEHERQMNAQLDLFNDRLCRKH